MGTESVPAVQVPTVKFARGQLALNPIIHDDTDHPERAYTQITITLPGIVVTGDVYAIRFNGPSGFDYTAWKISPTDNHHTNI